jgi:hypothetical protein
MRLHEYIAIRFLRQSDYDTAAPLSISPSPDFVIRVFMLFKGLATHAVIGWESPKPYFSQGPGIWEKIVGPGTNLTNQSYPFFVIELGGMEVT